MDIDKIKTAMADFTARLNAKFRENPSSAVTAQDADRVGNQTPAQFATAISADATAHIARRDNPHGETAASIGSETKTNVDYKAVGRVPTGVLPVSRFGSLNFLPIGVGGGFEGAIHPSDNLHIAMNMEDDGTLVILRPGTDGNVRGIYYAYVTDPLLPGKTIDIRTTSREYRPSFVPASYEYVRLLRSCKEAVFAYMRDPATNEEYFMIAWTQGSYDDAGHTGVLIPRSATPAWINTVGSLDIVYANGRFWMTFLTSQAGFGLRVMSVDAEEVRLGTATSLRDELGWETVNFYGDTVNHDIIQLAPVATSDVLANKPYILANQLGGGTLSVNVIRSNQDRTMQHSVLDKTTGRILMYIENQVGVNWTEPGTAGGGTWAPFVSSLWIDVVNRKAGVLGAPVGSSNPLTAPLTISNALGGNGVEYSGPLAARIKTSVNDRGTDYIYIPVKDGNGADTLARYTSSVNWYGTYSHSIAWHRYGPTVKLSDLLDSSQSLNATSTQSSPFRSQFGGSFGRRFGNPAFFSPTRVYVNCEGNRGNGAYAQLEAVGDAGTDWDFTYKSLNNGSIQGSVPRSWRSTVDEFAPGKSGLLDGLMHEFNISTPSSFVLNQANFSKDVRATAGRGLKADISETTTLIVQMAVLEQLHAKIVALATAQGLNFVDSADTVRSSWVILQNAPSFAQGMVLDTEGRIHLFVARCEPNTKTGTVTSYTFSDNTLKYIRGSNGFTRLYYSAGTQRRYPAGYAAETPNYWSYNLPSGWTLQQNGSSSLSRTTLLFNKNTGLFDVATLSSSGWQNDSSAIIFIPGHGICHSRCTSTEGDLLSKLVYNVRHVTEAEIVNGTIHDPTLRVLLSMLKPEQWNVTFSEDTDLIMSGRAYVLAAGTYMLSDVTPDPANKTFYVYVRVVAGRALYHFSLTELPESSSLMFVGTVVTGSAGITTVDIRKVTRLGKYRLSTTAVGSAIAVSLGAPQDTNKLNWT